ncbi:MULTISPECIES: hypothetical protein [Spirulina sp. CCY15215]|uniref:LIC_10190 family membrane protein n=1 Tax=Spirulina sp. CCY15215 TaxID=2767591 RepID=UPI001951992B|nr:hypothetical protein [Spirulina major]
MLFLLIIWLSLALTCWFIGVGILHRLETESFWKQGDRTILAIWLGLSFIAISLLGASLFVPLSPIIGLLITIGFLIITYHPQNTHREINTILAHFSWRWGGFLSFLMLILAAFASQKVIAYDTGFYHFPVIKWLSEYGVVPGLSLIHYTLGYPSSWLALAASFNAWILTDRATTVTGGFAVFLALVQFAICSIRIIKQKQQLSDWFFVISTFLCLPVLIWFNLPVSPSPDVAVTILAMVITWAILVLAGESPNPKQTPFDPYLIPIILATAAVTSKLSALPLLLTAAVFFSFSSSLQWKRIIGGGIFAIVLLFPLFGYAITATGCPLFPSSLFCLDFLPWSLGTDTVQIISQILKDCARWTCPPTAPPNYQTWEWVINWLQQEKRAVFLISCSILGFFVLQKKERVPGQNYLIGLGAIGTIFVMYGSPYLRIGITYFFVIPALLIAIYCQQRSPWQITGIWVIVGTANLWLNFSPTFVLLLGLSTIFSIVIWRYYRTIKAQLFLGFLLLLVSLVPLKTALISSENQIHWLLPDRIRTLNPSYFVQRKINDITYLIPDPNYRWERSPGFFTSEDRCWNAELPCTSELIHQNIRLRNPEKGLAGGFVRILTPKK